MTERVKGRTVAETLALFDQVHDLLTGEDLHVHVEELDKLAALGGVREYPTRVKCASLAWHALKAAVADDEAKQNVSTE
jgi:nitrogen fixation NifU-like protein